MANQPLTGILLVGGASTRFGSPKALAQLDHRSMAEIAWETLAFCDERVAVGKIGDGLELPFPLLDDGTDVRAPIAGLVAGLRAATNTICVVLPVDTPLVNADVLRALAAGCRDAAVPQTGPLPGAYRKTALPVLEGNLSAGRLALRASLDDLDVAEIGVDPALLVNVNQPDDLRSVS